MEKNIKRNVYGSLDHFAVQQKLTQLCKSTKLQLSIFKRESKKEIKRKTCKLAFYIFICTPDPRTSSLTVVIKMSSCIQVWDEQWQRQNTLHSVWHLGYMLNSNCFYFFILIASRMRMIFCIFEYSHCSVHFIWMYFIQIKYEVKSGTIIIRKCTDKYIKI